MNDRELIERIVGEQLCAVSFVQDYVEFHFDGPVIRALAAPIVKEDGQTIRCSCARLSRQAMQPDWAVGFIVRASRGPRVTDSARSRRPDRAVRRGAHVWPRGDAFPELCDLARPGLDRRLVCAAA